MVLSPFWLTRKIFICDAFVLSIIECLLIITSILSEFHLNMCVALFCFLKCVNGENF